jgi:hypothetical protein
LQGEKPVLKLDREGDVVFGGRERLAKRGLTEASALDQKQAAVRPRMRPTAMGSWRRRSECLQDLQVHNIL